MLSVGAIRFEDRFCASKESGIGGVGRVSARGAVHMVAALAGCREALVSTGFSPCQRKQAQEPLPSPCRGTISGLIGSIQSGEP